jgi:hypothetical protein
MTEPLDVPYMPNQVDVKCPECSSKAIFQFAQIIKISRKEDIDYFKNSKIFDYQQFDTPTGRLHAAIFYHGLHSVNEIKNLPEGYSIDIFEKAPNWDRTHKAYSSEPALINIVNMGATYCTTCGYRRKAKLHWPEDAYYQCSIKNHTLWAFNKEYLVALIDYIQSSHRHRPEEYYLFLLHLPSIFLERKNRETIVKKLTRMLEK